MVKVRNLKFGITVSLDVSITHKIFFWKFQNLKACKRETRSKTVILVILFIRNIKKSFGEKRKIKNTVIYSYINIKYFTFKKKVSWQNFHWLNLLRNFS